MRVSIPNAAAISLAVTMLNGGASALADQEAIAGDKTSTDTDVIENIFVYGEPHETKTATKLNLSVFETPQIVSVISRTQIEDFSLREVNSVLQYATGVTVEQVETGRTYYTARGFDIVNFQFDGVGVPFSYGLSQGHDDTALYEQVEIVKGATGLTTGLANPSATINYVRKRPTDDLQASVTASGGTWNRYRVDGDISGPIIGDKLKGRLVVAKQDGDSYLDRYSQDVTVFYGVLSGNITDSTRFTVGHSINDNHNDGNSSGALPLFYSDGSLTDYDVSTNTAPDWAYQDVKQNRTFVELEQDLNDKWTAKAIYSRNVQNKEWTSFYLWGAPSRETNEGLVGVASKYIAKDKEDIVDLYVSGSFSFLGREHELVVGVNLSDIKLTGQSIYSSEWSGYDDPVGADWALGATPRPAFDIEDPVNSSTDIDRKQHSYYVSSRLKPTDRLSFVLGARYVDLDQKGISYGAGQDVSDSELVPYFGATYEVFNGTMLYSSYSEVFQQQAWVNADLEPLGPVRGKSMEVGLKQEFYDGKALFSLSIFKSKQKNFGEWVTRDIDTGLNVYRGVDFESNGFEVEVAGEVVKGLNVNIGYTHLDVKDQNDNDIRRFIPTKQFKLAVAYQLPMVEDLRMGAGLNWQNEMYYGDTEVQGDYALVDLFARYDLTANLSASLNVNNVGNTKYRLSPQWGQANYGASRNMMASITWRY